MQPIKSEEQTKSWRESTQNKETSKLKYMPTLNLLRHSHYFIRPKRHGNMESAQLSIKLKCFSLIRFSFHDHKKCMENQVLLYYSVLNFTPVKNAKQSTKMKQTQNENKSLISLFSNLCAKGKMVLCSVHKLTIRVRVRSIVSIGEHEMRAFCLTALRGGNFNSARGTARRRFTPTAA